MENKVYTINEIRDIVTPIAKKYRLTHVYLFGSYARGEATEKSDVDLRVGAENVRGFFAMGGLYADLEEALNKSLDLVATEALFEPANQPHAKHFYNRIRKEEILLYEPEKDA